MLAIIPIIVTILLLTINVNNAFASSGQGQLRGPTVNWYEICTNPLVDILIAEDCRSLVTSGGYELSPLGERVLACIGGGTLAVLVGLPPEALVLGSAVGCGGSSGSNSGIGSIISGLLN